MVKWHIDNDFTKLVRSKDRFNELTDLEHKRLYSEVRNVVLQKIEDKLKGEVDTSVNSLLHWVLGLSDNKATVAQKVASPGSYADFDIDFSKELRGEVKQYLKGKFGEDRVSDVVTFNTLAAKAAVRSAARALGKAIQSGADIAKHIPDVPGIKLQEAFDASKQLQEAIRENDDAKEIWRIAIKFEGLPQALGVHACSAGEGNLLTVDGYKRIDSLDGTEVEILTKVGIKKALVFCSGIKRIYSISYSTSKYSGNKRKLYFTEDHKFFYDKGVCNAGESVGKNLGYYNFNNLNDMSIVSGWFWNDGNYDDRSSFIYFTPEKDKEMKSLCDNLDIITPRSRSDMFHLSKKATNNIELLHGSGFKFKTVDKDIPIFKDMQNKLSWLKGFLSANASVQENSIRIKISSFKLICFILTELELLGITGSIVTKKGVKRKFPNGEYQCNDSYQLELTRTSSFLYKYLIGFLQPYKNDKIKDCFYQDIKYERTDKVYDFSVITKEEESRNGYIDGILVHNCAFVISDKPTTEYVPSMISTKKDGASVLTQYEYYDVEEQGVNV